MIIYKLTSPSGKSYIGLTTQSYNPEVRFKQHCNEANKGTKGIPYDSIRKYGKENFIIEVLDIANSIDELKQKEMHYIEKFNTINEGYNVNIGGDKGHYGRDLPEDHKNNISKSRKEWFQTEEGKLWKQKLSENFKNNNPSKKGNIPWNKGIEWKQKSEMMKGFCIIKKGQKLSENHKQNISLSKKGQKLSEEHKNKISNSKKGDKQTEYQKKVISEKMQKEWIVTDPFGKEYHISNLRQFALQNNLDPGNMSRGGSKGWKAKLYK